MGASRFGALSLVALLAACGSKEQAPAVSGAEVPKATATATATAAGAAAVTATRLAAADREPGSWMTYGRTYDEQRFSLLQQITADNVSQLHLYDVSWRQRFQWWSVA